MITKAQILRENKALCGRLEVAERDRDPWKQMAEQTTADLAGAHKSFSKVVSGRGTRIRTRRLINLGNFEHAFIEIEVESAGGEALAADTNKLVDTVDKLAALLRRRIELTRALGQTEQRIERVKRIALGKEGESWMVETSPSLDELGQQLENQMRDLRILDAMWTGSGEPVDRAPVVEHSGEDLKEEE